MRSTSPPPVIHVTELSSQAVHYGWTGSSTMRNDVHFWIATLFRGFVALLFGSAVIAIPDLAKILLLRPFALAISVLFLATYGLLDSAVVFVTSFMADSRRARLALLAQGVVGTVIAVLLLTIAYEHARLEWFLYFVV